MSRAKVGDLEIEVEVVRYNRLILHLLVPPDPRGVGEFKCAIEFSVGRDCGPTG
jgi:hypothetical protein